MYIQVLEFIFQLCEYPCNITHDIYIFFSIYHGYFKKKKKKKPDIPRIFLEHKCILTL